MLNFEDKDKKDDEKNNDDEGFKFDEDKSEEFQKGLIPPKEKENE